MVYRSDLYRSPCYAGFGHRVDSGYCLAVVLVLFMGLSGMALSGRITPIARNKLMRVRVYLQGLIVLLVLITFAASALN